MRKDDLPEEVGISGQGPELLWALKRTTAENPPFHQIGMHVARFFDRKVALVDRSMALGAETHLFFKRTAREDLFDLRLRVVVKRGFHAVSFQNGEPDLVQRVAKLLREDALLGFIAAEESPDVARADAKIRVELLARILGKVIRLLLLHLLVADEVLVQRADPIFLRRHEA